VFLLLSFSTFAEDQSNSLPDILPYYSVENEDVRDFAKAMVRAYLLYGQLDGSGTDTPNFIFLSGNSYLVDGSPQSEKLRKVFPGMSDEEFAKLKSESDFCLVFRLKISGILTTVGVNEFSSNNIGSSYQCILDALTIFFDPKNIEAYKSSDFRAYSRNIIRELERRFNG
jgi:hypothetical protein